MSHLGMRAVSSTIYIPFTTHAASGAAVAPSTAIEAADVILYKNGSATQRTSQAGWTMTSPFDSITGLHMLAIDLSDNTDAGFYAAGSSYIAVLSPDETVDSLAVVRVIAEFDIGVMPANVTQWLGTAAATPTVAGVPEVDITHIGGTAVTAAAGIPEVKVASLAAGAITAAAVATGAIDADALAADAVAEIADGVWDEDATGHQTQGSYGQAIGDPGANTKTIYTMASYIGVDGAELTAIPWNAAWDAEVQSEAQDAITASALATAAALDTVDNFLDTEIAAIKTVTDAIGATGTGLTAVPWNAAWDAEVQSEVKDALDTAITDSVPADGAMPSVSQAAYMLVQLMTEKVISGTTLTVRKPDGSTTLMTITLNDATNPTSITRAT